MPWLEAASTTPWRAGLWLTLAALVLFLPGFFTLPPVDRDEPRFAQASKQMIETGDFIAIRFQGEARNKKPVGIYWLQAASVELAEALGVPGARGQIAIYRLPSLLGAIASVLLTYWAGLAFGSRRAAFIAALLFSATVLLGAEARLAKTDAVVTATVAAAMGAFARIALSDTRRSSLSLAFVFWTALAVGILVKGPITPMVPLFAGAILAGLQRRSTAPRRWLEALRPISGVIWCLLLVSPWFALILVKTGGAFLADSVGKDMLGKVAGGQELHGAPPGSYLSAFFFTGWPLAPLAVLAAPYVWRHRREPGVSLLLAWLLPSWLLFELVPTKLPHYVLPLYPAVAILVASGLERSDGVLRSLPIRAVATLLAWAVPTAFLAATFMLGRFYGLAFPESLWFYAPLVFISGTVAAWMLWQSSAMPAHAPFGAIAMLAATAALMALLLFPGLVSGGYFTPFTISPRLLAVAETARRDGPGCGRLGYATASYREPSLVFLAGTDLEMTDAIGAAHFLAGAPCRAAFVEAHEEKSFQTTLGANPSVKLVGRVEGVNLNSGRRLDIGVYARGSGGA